MKMHSAVYWQKLVATIGAVLILMVAVTITQAQGAVQRPLEDFLSTQGTFCAPPGCVPTIPPDPDFIGWFSALNKPPVYGSGVDYAGLANAYPSGQLPEISGTVSERPLADGRAEVTVNLHTKNANTWVVEIDPTQDFGVQVANNPTLFGHRPADVMAGQGQALADCFLHVVFINTAPGAPLPDLLQLFADPEPGQEVKTLSFESTAKGPLTAAFGVPEGTPGQSKISQTGLISHAGGNGNGVADAFPAEKITVKQVGQ